jgi:hypothetical protein
MPSHHPHGHELTRRRPPIEDARWRELIARGQALRAQDEFRSDPDDPDFRADLVPHAAITPLRMALADLMPAVLEASNATVRPATLEFPDQVERSVPSGGRGLPTLIIPRRDCKEPLEPQIGP